MVSAKYGHSDFFHGVFFLLDLFNLQGAVCIDLLSLLMSHATMVYVASAVRKEAAIRTKKTERNLTVYYSTGSGPIVPMIRLQGRWLSDIGFDIGKNIVVSIQDNKLTIQLASSVSSSEN